MLFITVSRQTGSLGKEITELLAQKLDLPVITRDLAMNRWFPDIANKHELHMLSESPGFFLNPSSEGISFAEYLENRLRNYIDRQPAIIFGLGAQIIFADHPKALHIKIMASHPVRTKRIMQAHCLEQKDAERFLELTDRKHKRYIATIYGRDWSDPTLYDITLNTDRLDVPEAAEMLSHAARNKHITREIPENSMTDQEKQVFFKHPSEEEFAKILDMHDIEWEYEPRTFPTQWDTEGNVTQAFSPDFYLPRFDSYIELTTMNQKYVSEKKKKVQLVKKLYPGTNINIVFKDDFNTLLKRFKLRDDE